MHEFLNLLENATEEVEAKDLMFWRCMYDLDLFAVVYFPHYCKKAFSSFHSDLFEFWNKAERPYRRAVGAPRGYAKSTFSALIKAIHDICYELEQFIVIVSETRLQANAKIKDIRAEILNNVELVRDYKVRFKTKKPAESQFVVNVGENEIMVQAFSCGAEMRGIRFGPHRPSKLILDDAEDSEEVHNEELRAKHRDWYFDVISNVGDEETNIELVGTVLHRDSLLMNLVKNPAYDSIIYKAILSWAERQDLWDEWSLIYMDIETDKEVRARKAETFYIANQEEMLEGVKVLWPEKEPYVDLMKQLAEKGRRSFMKEKQNMPMAAEDVIFEDIHWYREVEGGVKIESNSTFIPWSHLENEAYGVLDPATGQVKAKRGKLGDYSCLLTGYNDPYGRLLVHKVYLKRVAPTKYINEIFEHHDKYGYNKFGVETNLYRNLLLPNIVKEKKEREKKLKKKIKIPFYDIESTENKEKRIYTLEPKVSHGWIVFNRTLDVTFMDQLLDFPHADHDDGPDALEMLYGLINKRYGVKPVSMNTMGAN